jgi:hypothetical protein
VRIIRDAAPGMALYNKKMGGVDKFDQNRQGRYALDKTFKTIKWYKKLIMGLIAFAMTNAWLMWKSGYVDHCVAGVNAVVHTHESKFRLRMHFQDPRWR